MFYGKLRQRIAGAIICATVFLIIGSFVFAAEPHEDPETAMPVYSGIALLKYYSGALDFVLGKDPAEVEARLEKMPFANIPQSLEEPAGDFATSGISISHLVVAVDKDMNNLRVLIKQYSLEEAIKLATESFIMLSQANSELERIEQATETTGEELKVFSAPAESDLKRSYDEVLDRIDRIRKMLALDRDLLIDILPGSEKIVELLETDITLEQLLEELVKLDIIPVELLETDITLEQLLEELVKQDIIPVELLETGITLEIQPTTAFVGDSMHFEGVLTSNNEPLAEREIDILLNSSLYSTVQTDAYGNYQGSLQVPYWYVPELDLQALYYPRGDDIGLYLASLSPVLKLEVLYYEAELEVTVENQAYPGLETMVTGIFDYGQSPPPNDRKVEIYLDDVLITEVRTQEVFAQRITIPPETDMGKHIVTVSSAAVGRYSPVVASAILNITLVTPILDINIPKVALMPGSVVLEGKLHSEVGPLSGALIKMRLGESRVELVSSEDGSFEAKIRVGMGFSLIGSQDLVIQAFPQEPWHASLDTARTVLIVNIMMSGILLAIIISLGIFLPGRLRRRGTYPMRRMRPTTVPAPPEPVPVYSITLADTVLTGGSKEEPRNKIFFWYRLVVRLIQGITKTILRPQQTLREFANESSGTLGPAAKLFVELTRRVEKLLYSKYMPSEEDVGRSQQLSHTIEEELKSEGV